MDASAGRPYQKFCRFLFLRRRRSDALSRIFMGEKMFDKKVDPLGKGQNPESILRRLPLERQTEIVARRDDGEAFIDLARELTKEGIPTSGQMLSDFCHWFKVREKLWYDADFALELAAECKKQGWLKTVDEERAAAQIFFNRSVLTDKDPKGVVDCGTGEHCQGQGGVGQEKVLLMKKEYHARKKAKEKVESKPVGTISDEEKEAAIRQIYGMSP